MAKSKKVSRKLRHKRDVAQKRRARAFYRMREQDRQTVDAAQPKDSTWVEHAAIAVAAVGLFALAHTVYYIINT